MWRFERLNYGDKIVNWDNLVETLRTQARPEAARPRARDDNVEGDFKNELCESFVGHLKHGFSRSNLLEISSMVVEE